MRIHVVSIRLACEASCYLAGSDFKTSTTQHILRRVSIAEALAAVQRYPLRLSASERVSLTDARGRVVAQDVVALEDVPPFERSSVDGFAVISSDVIGASTQAPVRLTISGEILMGKPAPGSLRAGHAMRIPTGGALPAGADGVIKVEDTRESEGHVEVLDGRGARDHVTARGADVRKGDELRKAGDVLTAAGLGMLAGAGHSDVSVYKKPVVALLVGGD